MEPATITKEDRAETVEAGASRTGSPVAIGAPVDDLLFAEIFAAQGRSYRGGAVENLEKAPMGKGHGNDGKPFDLETACYLKPIFAEYDAAVLNGTRLKLILLAGVKTMKSFTLEVCAGDHACNRSGDVAIFFGSENAAETTATTRILNFFKGDDLEGGGIPRFKRKMETMRSRFDETMGALKFPDKTFFILSANLGNTQQKNLAFVGLQDAFVTGTSGMIKEMMARTTQYEKECIIFIESQGGEKGYDFDTQYLDTDQRELHVVCPCCGAAHIFNWKVYDPEWMTRGKDFRATLPRARIKEIEERVLAEHFAEKHPTTNIQQPTSNGESGSQHLSPSPSPQACGEGGTGPGLVSEQGSWVHSPHQSLSLRTPVVAHHIGFEIAFATEELTAALKDKVAGFQRGPAELIKTEEGEYNEAAILRETCFECFHCGSIWRDDGEFGDTRIALDRSSFYVASRDDALPGNVGFNVPQWINRRLGWGGMMLEKLKCQRIAAELGNFMDLKQWWQKTAARTWHADINAKAPERPGASVYDAQEKIPGEKCRLSATDIQFKLTHMVYLAVAVGDGVPPRVLHYEWVKPPTGLTDHEAAEHCKKRVRELDKEFGILPINSPKDGAHEPGLVREWAAEDAVWAKAHDGHRWKPCWCAYPLLIGDDRPSYRWTHSGRQPTWERFKQHHWHKVQAIKDGKRTLVDVHHRLWSNPSIKEIAERWRDGSGAPKLQIHEKFLADKSKEGLWAQLTSERKLPWKGHPGKMRYDNQDRPNHAWDCWCMIIERMDELGYLNSFGPPPEDREGQLQGTSTLQQ